MPRATRRQFIRRTVMAFGGYLAVSGAACKPRSQETRPQAAPPVPLPGDGLKSLSAGQFQLIAAACERILPRDEDPGAADLGCAVYIDRTMADAEARETWGRALFGGMPALDKQSRGHFGKLFAEAAPEEQESLLAAWQQSRYSGEAAFFEVLHSLTMEGAFGDPVYGGNLGGRGFALVGFSPPDPRPAHSMHVIGK